MSTIYVTKFAMTAGILTYNNVEITGDMAVYRERPGVIGEFFHGNDWHYTKEAAVARAEDMRVKKIASLKKSLAKLEKLEFKP